MQDRVCPIAAQDGSDDLLDPSLGSCFVSMGRDGSDQRLENVFQHLLADLVVPDKKARLQLHGSCDL